MSLEKKLKNKIFFPSQIIARVLAVTIFCGIFFLFAANQASAAALYLRASSDQAKVDSLVTVNLFVDTQGKFINNAEAVIQFSNDLVEVVSVDYRSSIFSLWVEQPNFSNNSGRISFNGGIPDPGYKGAGGKVLSIVFKAKKAGTASFVFSGASVRENDGLGTDILSSQSSASVAIISNAPEKPVEEKPDKPITDKPTTPPAAEEASSQTSSDQTGGASLAQAIIYAPAFPDSDSWYSVNSGALSLKLPSGASAIQTLLDHNPNSVPTIKYSGSVYLKNLSDLDDGVWYFHARYLVNSVWSKITHFRIQIDTKAPTGLSITPEKINNCVTGLKLKATDALSGLDYYLISIDDQPAIKVAAQSADDMIPWPQTDSGRHTVVATVFDKAGNKTEAETQVDIASVAAPVIDSFPAVVKVGDRLNISGHTNYPDSPLKLVISYGANQENTYDVMTDKEGKFVFVSEPIAKAGTYSVAAYVVGCNNVNGSLSAKSQISAGTIQALKKIPNLAPLGYYSVAALILFLSLMLLAGWYKYLKLGRRLSSTKRVGNNLARSLLLEKANKDILVLGKAKRAKRLTRGEEIALENLKETISRIKMLDK